MTRTTLNVENEIYKRLVEESLKKYGTTRNISKILNEKLRLAEQIKVKQTRRVVLPTIKLKRKIDWKFVEKKVEKEMEDLWKE